MPARRASVDESHSENEMLHLRFASLKREYELEKMRRELANKEISQLESTLEAQTKINKMLTKDYDKLVGDKVQLQTYLDSLKSKYAIATKDSVGGHKQQVMLLEREKNELLESNKTKDDLIKELKKQKVDLEKFLATHSSSVLKEHSYAL